eukprot:Skav221923  [mRNA]  locus=scaffold195:73210:78697:+ [translate_table: standard]
MNTYFFSSRVVACHEVCDESTEDYQLFNISLGDHPLLEPLADLCSAKESWWRDSACARSVVDTMAPLLVSKMITRAFLQPIILLLRWQLSYVEDGQLYMLRGALCTSGSLELGQQASLLVTWAEIALLWGALVQMWSAPGWIAGRDELTEFHEAYLLSSVDTVGCTALPPFRRPTEPVEARVTGALRGAGGRAAAGAAGTSGAASAGVAVTLCGVAAALRRSRVACWYQDWQAAAYACLSSLISCYKAAVDINLLISQRNGSPQVVVFLQIAQLLQRLVAPRRAFGMKFEAHGDAAFGVTTALPPSKVNALNRFERVSGW